MKKQFQWVKVEDVVCIFESKYENMDKYDSVVQILKEIQTIFQEQDLTLRFYEDLQFVYTPATNCVALEVYDYLLDYRFYNIMQGKPSRETVEKDCKEMLSSLGGELHPDCKIIYNFDELFSEMVGVKSKIKI